MLVSPALDHVIYGTADLDAAQRRMEQLGLTVVPGGVHEGQGTHNRIVPLGETYIELMAISDPAEAADHPFGHRVRDAIAKGDGLIGWAVRVVDGAPAVRAAGLTDAELRP